MTYSSIGPIQWMVLVEFGFAVAALLASFFLLDAGSRFFTSAGTAFDRLAQDRRVAILIAALLPMTIRALILPIYPPPPPAIADDYSYLFLGETFALGRWTNPTPPLPRHFETNFEILTPTFSSQYQPGQGIVIALGKILTDQPWWGIFFSVGLFFGILCWALQAVLPCRWALLGTLICVVQFGVFGIFMNSYRSATVAAAGGALAFGCIPRMITTGKKVYGFVAGFAVVLMLAGRPFEGGIWSVVICVIILRMPGWKGRTAVGLPFAVVVALGLALLAFYDLRVTGSPFELPYTQYRKLYGTQGFWFQSPFTTPSSAMTPDLQREYEHQLSLHAQRGSVNEIVKNLRERMDRGWQFFLGPILTVVILFFPLLLTRRKNRSWLLIALCFVCDHITFHTWYPNQSSPEYALVAFLLVQCWRHMRCASLTGRRVGRPLSRWLATAGVATLLIPIAGKSAEPILPGRFFKARAIWFCEFITEDPRGSVIDYLKHIPGRHLVFVDWSNVVGTRFEDWIYNQPNLADAELVWARSLGGEEDRRLVRELKGRDTWMLDGRAVPAIVHPWARDAK